MRVRVCARARIARAERRRCRRVAISARRRDLQDPHRPPLRTGRLFQRCQRRCERRRQRADVRTCARRVCARFSAAMPVHPQPVISARARACTRACPDACVACACQLVPVHICVWLPDCASMLRGCAPSSRTTALRRSTERLRASTSGRPSIDVPTRTQQSAQALIRFGPAISSMSVS